MTVGASMQLISHGKAGLLSEEILGEVRLALLVLRHIVQVECGYLEHLSCTLAVRCRDERGVEIYESLAVEVLMDGEGHLVAHAEDCTEGVGPWTHVSDCSEILERSILLLERIAHRVALTVNLDGACLDLHCLAAADRLDEFSGNSYAGSSGDLLEKALLYCSLVDYDLDIVDG